MQQIAYTASVQQQTETLDQIRFRVADAVWTLRHLQFPVHGVPSGYRTGMPEPIRSFWEAYEQKAPRLTRQRPQASQIARMDEVLPWFYFVTDPQARAALFCRHTPLSWRTVGRILSISHTWARKLEADAVDEIRLALRRGGVNKNQFTKVDIVSIIGQTIG